MKYLFITEISPLSPLLDFDISSINVDLHNDFEGIQVKNSDRNLEFSFKRVTQNELYNEQNAALIFSGIIETNIESIIKNNQLGDIRTLTNFAKGELSESNNYYEDKSTKYFFIDFVNGSLINIFCKEAVVFLW